MSDTGSVRSLPRTGTATVRTSVRAVASIRRQSAEHSQLHEVVALLLRYGPPTATKEAQ